MIGANSIGTTGRFFAPRHVTANQQRLFLFTYSTIRASGQWPPHRFFPSHAAPYG